MSEFGITNTGYNRKTFNDLIQEAQTRAQNLFGPDIQLSENSFFGLLLTLYMYYQDELWQLAEDTYNGAFIDTAEGVQLDAVVRYANIQRNQATPATGSITFSGTDGTVIPQSTIVTSGDVQFTTLNTVTIASGTASVNIRATTLGLQGNLPANTITGLFTAVSGVTSLTNSSATTGGTNEETDSELRARYFQTLQVGGKATVNAIRADILQVTGVRTVRIIENTTQTTSPEGLPPKTFEAIVDGGENEAVARAIFDSKAAGIGTFGTVTVSFIDDSGLSRTINFNRPIGLDVWVNITVTTNAQYPTNGDDLVQETILNFVNQLGVSDDLIVSQLVLQCFRVAGVVDAQVTVSTDGTTFTTNNIVAAIDRKIQTIESRVVITSV